MQSMSSPSPPPGFGTQGVGPPPLLQQQILAQLACLQLMQGGNNPEIVDSPHGDARITVRITATAGKTLPIPCVSSFNP